jgi:hypothetical protein
MEPNFQTSFIPKKPMVEERVKTSRPVGFLTVISIFLLFATVVASLGLYFYKGIITKNISKMANDLNLARERFEPEKIAQLQVLDKRLSAATEVLGKHVAISPIFETLGKVTLPTVRYTKFGYTVEKESGSVGSGDSVMVKMSGVAIGYRAIALQGDLFSKNKNIVDPVFSNLVLDDKGNVMFDLDFTINPTFVNYVETLKPKDETVQTTPADDSAATPTPSDTGAQSNADTEVETEVENSAASLNDIDNMDMN